MKEKIKAKSWKRKLSEENISSFKGYFRKGIDSSLRTSNGCERKFPEKELFPVFCFPVSQIEYTQCL